MMMATGGSREEGGRLPTGLRPDRPAPWARGAMTGIAGAAVLAGAVDLIGTALEHLIDD
jgi:hypothetical protein